jgi:O-antigen/teichoic acid export membrane protein
MSKVESVEAFDYVVSVAQNSLWNFVNYVVTGVAGVVAGVILTRTLGAQQYGSYAFFSSMLVVGSLFLDFGLGQAIAKYVPRYYNDPENKGLGIQIFLSTLAFQLMVSVLVVAILLLSLGYWRGLIRVDTAQAGILAIITVSTLVPAVLSKQVTNFLGATRNSKPIAIAAIVTQLLSLAMITIFGIIYKNLPLILLGQLAVNAVACAVLWTVARPLLRFERPSKKILPFNDLRTYSLLAYLNVILTFVVWSYSEVFFLGYYAPVKEVGFYTLAFSVASIVASVPGLYLRTAYTVQFELLELGEEERSDRIASMNVKLMSILFLPLAIYISYFAKPIVSLLYGSSYDTVSVILPLVLFGTIISTTIGSPIIKASNDNKVFGGTIALTLLGAIVNLILDYLLIPRYQSIGAGIANLFSQLILTAILLSYAFRAMRIHIDWLRIVKVYGINLILAGTLALASIASESFAWRLLIAAMSAYGYFLILVGSHIFDEMDAKIVSKVGSHVPRRIAPAFEAIQRQISRGLSAPRT